MAPKDSTCAEFNAGFEQDGVIVIVFYFGSVGHARERVLRCNLCFWEGFVFSFYLGCICVLVCLSICMFVSMYVCVCQFVSMLVIAKQTEFET